MIMNYIAVDAYRMGDTLWWFHTAWSLVLQLFHAIGILFKVVGLGALPGLIPIAVISCNHGRINSKKSSIRREVQNMNA